MPSFKTAATQMAITAALVMGIRMGARKSEQVRSLTNSSAGGGSGFASWFSLIPGVG